MSIAIAFFNKEPKPRPVKERIIQESAERLRFLARQAAGYVTSGALANTHCALRENMITHAIFLDEIAEQLITSLE